MGAGDSKHSVSADQTKEGSKLDKRVEALFKEMSKGSNMQCVEFETLQARLQQLPYDTAVIFSEHQGEVWKYGKFSDFVRPFLAIVTPACALFPFTDNSTKSDNDRALCWLAASALATGCDDASIEHPCLIAAVKHLMAVRAGEKSVSTLLIEYYQRPMRKLLIDISNSITGNPSLHPMKIILPDAPNGTCMSEMEYWTVFNCLPAKYFHMREQDDLDASCLFDVSNWTQLYNSDFDGLSLNRFEKKVFDYRGYTVTFLRMVDNRLYALGMDRTWLSSSAPLGGVDCCCMQVLPQHDRNMSVNVKCMTTSKREKENGLHVVSIGLEVPASMEGVASIEVYGCADATALAEQRKQKMRMERMADKNKEVPLPGHWDENPDRSLLEMAGVGAYRHSDLIAAVREQKEPKPE